jgi:transglutaminase-like putative cysteine protease
LAPRPTVTPLTAPDDAIREAAAQLRGTADVADVAESVADFIHRSFEYGHDVTSVRTTAAEAWQVRQGVCQDMAHVMIAMCTSLGVASRYVSGHLVGDGASHAWVEVFDHARQNVLAIDPTHGRRTDLRYVTTAAGRDYRDVAPTAGTYISHGGSGRLTVRKRIRLAELT